MGNSSGLSEVAAAACCASGTCPGRSASTSARPDADSSTAGEGGAPVVAESWDFEPVAPPVGAENEYDELPHTALSPPGTARQDGAGGLVLEEAAVHLLSSPRMRPGGVDGQTIAYEDGSSYTGDVDGGKRHGEGLWQSRTGKYEGQWQDNKQHGKGRQTWSNGNMYEGQFRNGKFAGCGRMTWQTRKGLVVYEGEYEDDLKCGKGRFIWADGRTYDGDWFQGKRHGRGRYMNTKCEHKVGFWASDRFLRWEIEAVSANASGGAPTNIGGGNIAGNEGTIGAGFREET